MDFEEYNKWKDEKTKGKSKIEEWEPVGCVTFNENEFEKSIVLECKRTCRYVLVIATSIRKEFKNIADFS
jgi:hypothetical protein